MNTSNIRLSAIDEDRFGMRTAKVSAVTSEQLPGMLEFCRANEVKFLIARCPVYELQAAQAMEKAGFTLMDTLVYYSRRVDAPIPPYAEALTLRPVWSEDAEQVRLLAARAFRGYGGHYHADLRLERDKCDAVYSSWAYRSCVSRDVADEVLVAEQDGNIVGFITLRIHSPEEGEGPLYGVDPDVQRHGVGRNLMIGALRWFESKHIKQMFISTQITNFSSQKVWVRLGFEPNRAEYTFHKWFD